MKKVWTKRICAALIAVCLAAGTFFQGAQATTLTVEAAKKAKVKTSTTTLNKKIKAVVKKAYKAAEKAEKSEDATDESTADTAKSKAEIKRENLEKVFNYAVDTYQYSRSTKFSAAGSYKNWQRDYAYEMYRNKKGTCYHDAAAFAYLAKKVTGYTVRVAIGQTNGFNKTYKQSHAWVEIMIKKTWYVCDTSLERFTRNSTGKEGKYFLIKKSKLKSVYNKYKKTKYVTIK